MTASWKRMLASLALAVSMVVTLGACTATRPFQSVETDSEYRKPITVFAAASLTESLKEATKAFEERYPEYRVVFNFDSSGTLKSQIAQGAQCDVFISAGKKQMDQLDIDQNDQLNPERLDYIDPSTRLDLLSNTVVLATSTNNPKQVKDFSDLKRLTSGTLLMVMGNSDVPVGQYTQKILTYLGLSEQELVARKALTYGNNVKEVTAQIASEAADMGVVYQTDAYSAGLHVVATATPEMCGYVLYPAALLKQAPNRSGAERYLEFLQTQEAWKSFEKVGFSRPNHS